MCCGPAFDNGAMAILSIVSCGGGALLISQGDGEGLIGKFFSSSIIAFIKKMVLFVFCFAF